MAAGQVSWQRTRIGDVLGDQEFENSPPLLAALMGAAPLGSNVSLANKVRLEAPPLTRAERYTPWTVLMDVTLTGDVPALAATYGIGVRNLLDWPVVHPGGPDVDIDVLPQLGRSLFATTSVAF